MSDIRLGELYRKSYFTQLCLQDSNVIDSDYISSPEHLNEFYFPKLQFLCLLNDVFRRIDFINL